MGKSGKTINRMAATPKKSAQTARALRAAKRAKNCSTRREIVLVVSGGGGARTQTTRPVRSVPVTVVVNGGSVLPFSAFILGMDRECQVEDNVFSREDGV